jgi:hypothetical protein
LSVCTVTLASRRPAPSGVLPLTSAREPGSQPFFQPLTCSCASFSARQLDLHRSRLRIAGTREVLAGLVAERGHRHRVQGLAVDC